MKNTDPIYVEIELRLAALSLSIRFFIHLIYSYIHKNDFYLRLTDTVIQIYYFFHKLHECEVRTHWENLYLQFEKKFIMKHLRLLHVLIQLN